MTFGAPALTGWGMLTVTTLGFSVTLGFPLPLEREAGVLWTPPSEAT